MDTWQQNLAAVPLGDTGRTLGSEKAVAAAEMRAGRPYVKPEFGFPSQHLAA